MSFSIKDKVVVTQAPYRTHFKVGAKGIIVATYGDCSVVKFTEGDFMKSKDNCWYVCNEHLEICND